MDLRNFVGTTSLTSNILRNINIHGLKKFDVQEGIQKGEKCENLANHIYICS